MTTAQQIAKKIAQELDQSYIKQVLSKAKSVDDINHDEDFWNSYKEACVEAYEDITGDEFDEDGIELLEEAEDIVFQNKFYM